MTPWIFCSPWRAHLRLRSLVLNLTTILSTLQNKEYLESSRERMQCQHIDFRPHSLFNILQKFWLVLTSRFVGTDIKALAELISGGLVTAVECQNPSSNRHKICRCLNHTISCEIGICRSWLGICSSKSYLKEATTCQFGQCS